MCHHHRVVREVLRDVDPRPLQHLRVEEKVVRDDRTVVPGDGLAARTPPLVPVEDVAPLVVAELEQADPILGDVQPLRLDVYREEVPPLAEPPEHLQDVVEAACVDHLDVVDAHVCGLS
jgi:hypothetical protein